MEAPRDMHAAQMFPGYGQAMNEPNYREWSETVMDWITEQPVEVRFRSDGEQTWVWSPSGDGIGPDGDFEWAKLERPATSE